MKQSANLLKNAENCAHLAEQAKDDPTYKRYKRMEEAWRSLAEEQAWLDGEKSPVEIRPEASSSLFHERLSTELERPLRHDLTDRVSRRLKSRGNKTLVGRGEYLDPPDLTSNSK